MALAMAAVGARPGQWKGAEGAGMFQLRQRFPALAADQRLLLAILPAEQTLSPPQGAGLCEAAQAFYHGDRFPVFVECR